MGDSQSRTSFGPEWKIELEQRSSRTWILHVTNTGRVASSFIPLGLSIAVLSPLQEVRRLTLRALSKSLRLGTQPSTLLNPGENVEYELWLALDKEHEPLQGESIELQLVLNYLRPTFGLESAAGQDSELLTLSIHHPGWNIYSSTGSHS